MPPGITAAMDPRTWALAVGSAYLLLFGATLWELPQDLWGSPDHGHGLLLVPTALYLAWRIHKRPLSRSGNRIGTSGHRIGLLVVGLAVALFLAGTLAAEVYTPRLAALLAAAGLVLYYGGMGRLRAYWLPLLLLALAIPLPEVLLSSVTLPLQLLASRLAVELLEFRHVPAELAGNIILLPGRELFVAEACSGLRYLAALIAFALLLGGTALSAPVSRLALVAMAVPAALAANAARVFLTGYLAFYSGWSADAGAYHTAIGIGVFTLSVMGVWAALLALRQVER